ncbi:ATP-binding protein, partial [Pseudanabaena sp. FACHB-1277]|nr:ATP-binding protein [Pseudanabaena cinerea FACHB-1277]
MKKHFNTAGPCQPDIHYMLSSVERMPQIKALIDQRNYFVIHAPRQVGKTTAMLTLAQELTASGEYTALMVSVEVGSPFPDQPEIAEKAILGAWAKNARFWLPKELHPPAIPEAEAGQR